MFALTRRQRAHVIIHNAAAAAGGIGAGWLADLVLIPDVVPLSILQAAMALGIALSFRIRPLKAVLISLLAVFFAAIAGRGLSTMLFLRFPDSQVLIDVGVAIGITESLGWIIYQALLALRRSNSRSHHSLMISLVQKSRHGPLRGLMISAPMLVSIVAAFAVPAISHMVEIHVKAAGGMIPLRMEHPLIELNQGLLRISGVPRGTDDRVEMLIKNDVLAAEMQRQVLIPETPRVSVMAYVQHVAPQQTIDATWSVAVDTISDYWRQVRERLYLLILGLIGTGALIWLGEQRSRSAAGV